MDIKNKHIAVVCDEKGVCTMLAKVKVVNQLEYNKLVNELELGKKEKDRKEKEQESRLGKYGKDIGLLYDKFKANDLLVAKSIYDNFVDRGLINDNDKFQKDFFDYIFNDCELKIENAPNDFQAILRKVGNL